MRINKDAYNNVDDSLNRVGKAFVPNDGEVSLLAGDYTENYRSTGLYTLHETIGKYLKDPCSLTHDQKIKLHEQISIYRDKIWNNPTFIYDTMGKHGIKKVEGTDISYTLKDVENLMNDAFLSE
ncbi:MAG: hypothetical protein ACI4CY_03855 [Candidatus Gastranaerophilaceae bacterium]